MTQYTPNMQIPYPEAGDAPRGNEQMQAIAEAVDATALPTWKAGVLQTPADSIEDNSLWTFVAGRVFVVGAIKINKSVTSVGTMGVVADALTPAGGWARWAVGMTGLNYTPAVGRLTLADGNLTVDVGAGHTWNGNTYMSGVSWFVVDPVAALAYFNAAATPTADQLAGTKE